MPHPDDENWSAGRKEYLVIFSLAVISIVVALDATIVVPALATLALDLHGNALETFWVGTSYLLPFAIFQPALANLSEIIGRRAALLLSLLCFTVGNIVCCVAQNMTQLLGGRVVQGIGGGGIITLTNVIISDIVPLRLRANYIAYVQVVWALGTILGPVLGGLFVQHSTWRWIFYINFPFLGFGFVLIGLFVSGMQAQEESWRAAMAKYDYMGCLLSLAGTTLFLMALTWAGVQFPWTSVGTLVPLIAGFLLLICSGLWKPPGGAIPFLKKSLFANRTSVAIYACALAQGIILYSEMYYIALYLEGVQGLSAVLAGTGLLAIGLSLVPTSIATARLISKTGQYCWAIWFGACFSTLANGLLVSMDTATSTAVWVVFLVLVGLSPGMLVSSLNLAAQAACQRHDMAAAAGFFTFIRSVGMAFGVALGGAVLQNVLEDQVSKYGLPQDFATEAMAYVAKLQSIEDADIKIEYQKALAVGLRAVFALTAGVCGCALTASLLIRRYSLNSETSEGEDSSAHGSRRDTITTMEMQLTKSLECLERKE